MKANSDYTFGIASLEIVLLLIGAFLLGMLLCWLLRKLGLCCRAQHYDTRHPPASTPLVTSTKTTSTDNNSSTTLTGGRKPREFPDVTSGGFTADINTLLRNRDTAPANEVPDSTANLAATGATLASAASTVVSTRDDVSSTTRKDDLKKLEGIGPKLEKILNAAGIQSYAQLAAMTPDAIRPILEAAGSQFKMHDPKSWPYQAELAAKGDWTRLKEYQHLLITGKE